MFAGCIVLLLVASAVAGRVIELLLERDDSTVLGFILAASVRQVALCRFSALERGFEVFAIGPVRERTPAVVPETLVAS